ncbi:hypothetical protein D3C84_1106890 [compost metagenome]
MDDVTPTPAAIALGRLLGVGLGNPVNGLEQRCPPRLSKLGFRFTQAGRYPAAGPVYGAIDPDAVQNSILVLFGLHERNH